MITPVGTAHRIKTVGQKENQIEPKHLYKTV